MLPLLDNSTLTDEQYIQKSRQAQIDRELDAEFIAEGILKRKIRICIDCKQQIQYNSITRKWSPQPPYIEINNTDTWICYTCYRRRQNNATTSLTK